MSRNNKLAETEFQATIRTLEDKYTAVYREDGFGSLYSEWNDEPFRHKLDLTKVGADYPQKAAREQFLTDYFWREVNPVLDNPFLVTYADLDSHELEFVAGTPAEFNRLMRLFMLTEPELEKSGQEEVNVRCAAENQEPQLNEGWGYFSPRLDSLVKLALLEHRPYGYNYEYNDQQGDRRSGYSLSPTVLSYELADFIQAAAREKMNARRELREWLVARQHDPAQFGLESWEKIR